MNDFDGVAPYYDALKRFVFGDALDRAARIHLGRISEGQSVLILGGGSGRCLEFLPCCEVDFLDRSAKMIAAAKERKTEASCNFVQIDFMEFEGSQKYDWILCPFFLDVFNADHLEAAIAKVTTLTTPGGKVVVTDFNEDRKFSSRVLLGSMHWFFKYAANLESTGLKDISNALGQSSLRELHTAYFLNRLVFSSVYEKT